jgi:hypothetical protein
MLMPHGARWIEADHLSSLATCRVSCAPLGRGSGWSVLTASDNATGT